MSSPSSPPPFVVRFESITPQVEDRIYEFARVSNLSPSNASQTDALKRFVCYCIKNGHWSVFEMAHMTVYIETSRAISSQIIRHKSFSFQEFSQRYSAVFMPPKIYEARAQDAKNRQNSLDTLDDSTKKWYIDAQHEIHYVSIQKYKEALDKGIAKECARFLLPMSSTTRLYMTGNIRSWIHYLNLRSAPETQKEHRDIACAIIRIFKDKLPVIADACAF